MSLFYYPVQMTIRVTQPVVRPTFIRYTPDEIEAMRAKGDDEGVSIAERMNAACDLAEGIGPADKRVTT